MYAEDRAGKSAVHGSSESLASTKSQSQSRLDSVMKKILAKRFSQDQDSTTKTSLDTPNTVPDELNFANKRFNLDVPESNLSSPHLLTVPNALTRRHVKLCHSEHSNLSKIAESISASMLSPRLSEPIIHSVDSLPKVCVQRDSGSLTPCHDNSNQTSRKPSVSGGKSLNAPDRPEVINKLLGPTSSLKFIDS